jgi:hypothetical protein
VIVGADSPEQVDGWIATGDLDLSADRVKELTDLAAQDGLPLEQTGYSSVDPRVVSTHDAT